MEPRLLESHVLADLGSLRMSACVDGRLLMIDSVGLLLRPGIFLKGSSMIGMSRCFDE